MVSVAGLSKRVDIEGESNFDVVSLNAAVLGGSGEGPDQQDGLICEHCGSESLTLIEEIEKPSWQDVLRIKSDECPGWYRETIELDDRHFWDEAM